MSLTPRAPISTFLSQSVLVRTCVEVGGSSEYFKERKIPQHLDIGKIMPA